MGYNKFSSNRIKPDFFKLFEMIKSTKQLINFTMSDI